MSNAAFHTIMDTILRHEGGYVDHPHDPGGETNFGISKRAFPKEDIKNLTVERAKTLYYQRYWVPSKADQLPERLQPVYMDTAVNCGVVAAIRLLQLAAGVEADGIYGTRTHQAARGVTVEAYVQQRLAYYERLIKRNPKLATFRKGWTRRTKSFLP